MQYLFCSFSLLAPASSSQLRLSPIMWKEQMLFHFGRQHWLSRRRHKLSLPHISLPTGEARDIAPHSLAPGSLPRVPSDTNPSLHTSKPDSRNLTCPFLKIYSFIFLALLGLRCCGRVFSSCCKWGLLSNCGAQASCGGFSCRAAWALGCMGSVAATCEFSG